MRDGSRAGRPTRPSIRAWGTSISRERAARLAPGDRRPCFFVREAWPSPTFGTSLTAGMIEADQTLEIVSELDEGGVLFGDGIETDRLAFGWGVQATVRVAPERLRLVQATG